MLGGLYPPEIIPPICGVRADDDLLQMVGAEWIQSNEPNENALGGTSGSGPGPRLSRRRRGESVSFG